MVRQHFGHTVMDTLEVVAASNDDGRPHVFVTARAVPCCPAAPQDDVQYLLFRSGWHVSNTTRAISDGLACDSSSANVSLALERRANARSAGGQGTSELIPGRTVTISHPQTQVEISPRAAVVPKQRQHSPLVDDVLLGFRAMINGDGEFEAAFRSCLSGDATEPSLLAVFAGYATKQCDGQQLTTRLESRAKSRAKEFAYCDWMTYPISDCLTYFDMKHHGQHVSIAFTHGARYQHSPCCESSRRSRRHLEGLAGASK